MNTRRGYVFHGDAQVHYRLFRPADRADGPALVLSHQSPSSSLMFSAAVPHLVARGLTCIAVDTPGFGLSDVPDPRPAVADYAAALVPVLDHFGLAAAHFLGHHTGAANATAFAVRHPARVLSLVLNGPPVFTAAERGQRLAKPLGPVPLSADGAHLAARWNARLAATPGWTDLGAMHRNLLGTLLAGDTAWYGHRAAYEYDMAADFAELACRTLILTNTGDDIYHLAQRARAMRPDMAYVELSGGTHDIVDEQPQAWAAAVADFVLAD
jgi:pimeloyl-ACP methyl ester carboxylesterase